MKGRRPTPTNLKLLRGTARKSRMRKNEPQPLRDMPACPGWLNKFGKECWNELAPVLYRMGVLTKADGPAFALLCVAYSEYRHAGQVVEREGNVIETGDGVLKIHPCQRIKSDAADRLLSMMREFGMTPSSRCRISATPPEEENDPLDEFLNRRTTKNESLSNEEEGDGDEGEAS